MIVASETRALLGELNQGARAIDALSIAERSVLLRRAAQAIRDYREEIAFSDTCTGKADIVALLDRLAANVEDYPDGSVGAVMLDAVQAINALKTLLDCKYEVILEDAKPKGRA